jgi:TolA-binding protein
MSCGVWYQTFISYFNTYYNASSTFQKGEESLKTLYKTKAGNYPVLQDLRYVSYLEVPADAKNNFNKVIEKCSKILNSYKQSNLVDNALLLIGMSYYYNLEYTRAERKFLELIAQYPNSSLIPTAKLWSARAFLKNRKLEEAKIVFDDIREYAKREKKNDLILETYLILADYSLLDLDTLTAIDNYSKAIDYTSNKEIVAQINYRLGDLFEKTGDLLQASTYYFKTSNSSDNVVKYWGMNRYGKIQVKFGNLDVALRIFQDLEKNPLLFEYIPNTLYEIGVIKLETNQIDEAIDVFTKVDTTYPKTEASAMGYYHMGLLHENVFYDYPQARVYYQKSKEQMGNLPISPFVDDRIKKLDMFLTNKKAYYLADSMYIIAKIPDTLVIYNYDINISSKIADTIKIFNLVQQDTFASNLILEDSIDMKYNISIEDSINMKDSINIFERDSMILNLTTKDSSIIIKDTIISLVENLIDTVKSTENFKNRLQTIYGKYTTNTKIVDTIIVTELEVLLFDDTTRINKTFRDLGRKTYDYANSWFNQIGKIDTAVILYERLLYSFPKDNNYYPELIFALSSQYVKDSVNLEIADSLLHLFLTENPTHPSAFAARMILGIPIEVKIDTAMNLYALADSFYVAGNVEKSLRTHVELVEKFPWSDFAAKSQYAIAWINENDRNKQQEAITQYRKLAENFPKSNYASLVKAKLDTVEKYFPSPKRVIDTTSKTIDSVKTTAPAQPPIQTTKPTKPIQTDSVAIIKPPSNTILDDKTLIPAQKTPQIDTIQTRRKRDIQ